MSREELPVTRVGKIEMSRHLANRFGISQRQAAEIYEAVSEHAVQMLLQGQSVTFPGLGTLEVTETEARVGVRPGTRERIMIQPGRKVSFRTSTLLKPKLRH